MRYFVKSLLNQYKLQAFEFRFWDLWKYIILHGHIQANFAHDFSIAAQIK